MSSSPTENMTRLGGNESNDRPQDNTDSLSGGDDASGTHPAAGEQLIIPIEGLTPTEGLTETELEELAQAPLPERVAADLSRYWSGEPQPGTRSPKEIPPDIFAFVLMSPAVDYPLPRSIGFTLREWIMTEKIHYAPSTRIMGRAIKARNAEIAYLKLKVKNIERHGSNEDEITSLKAQIATLELATQEMGKELSDKTKDLDNVENEFLDLQEEYNNLKNIERHGSNEDEITSLKAQIATLELATQEMGKELSDKTKDLDNVENEFLDLQEEFNHLKAGAALSQEYTETREQFHKRMIKSVLHEFRYQKELEDRIAILNRTIDDQNQLLDQHISGMLPDEAEMVHTRRSESGLSRAYESLELEHDALRQNLHDLQDAHDDLKRKFTEEHNLRKEANKHHDDLHKNFLIAQTELTKLHAAKQAVDAKASEHDHHLKHMNLEIEEISGLLQKTRTELRQANGEISRLQRVLQSAQTLEEELASTENQRAQYERGYRNNGDLKYDILVISDDLDRLTLEKEQRESALEQEIRILKKQLKTSQRALARNVEGLGIMMGGDGVKPESHDDYDGNTIHEGRSLQEELSESSPETVFDMGETRLSPSEQGSQTSPVPTESDGGTQTDSVPGSDLRIANFDEVVDRPVEVEKIVYVDRPVEVEKIVYVDRPVEVDRPGNGPVPSQPPQIIYIDRPQRIRVPVYVDRPVMVETRGPIFRGGWLQFLSILFAIISIFMGISAYMDLTHEKSLWLNANQVTRNMAWTVRAGGSTGYRWFSWFLNDPFLEANSYSYG